MTITTNKLTRAAGLSAVAGGLLFIAVQIKHPHLDATFATTTEYAIRETMKILMAVLSVIGITGIYLRQVKQTGVLGLLGYLLFGAGYLAIMSVQIVGVFVLPSFAATQPGYVNDVFAVATGGTPGGDIGALAAFIRIGGFTFLTGGVVFGIALFRANILPRWAAALLVAGSCGYLRDPPAAADQPEAVRHPRRRRRRVPRLFPVAGAAPTARALPSPVSAQPDLAGAR